MTINVFVFADSYENPRVVAALAWLREQNFAVAFDPAEIYPPPHTFTDQAWALTLIDLGLSAADVLWILMDAAGNFMPSVNAIVTRVARLYAADRRSGPIFAIVSCAPADRGELGFDDGDAQQLMLQIQQGAPNGVQA